MVEGLKSDSPAARASIIGGLVSGTGPESAAASAATGLPSSRFSFDAVPIEKQVEVLDALVKANTDLIGAAAKTGSILRPGAELNFDAITANASHPLSDQQVQLAQLAYLKTQGLPLAQQALTNAQASSDPRAILNSASAVADLSAKMRELSYNTNYALRGLVQFGDQVQQSLGTHRWATERRPFRWRR